MAKKPSPTTIRRRLRRLIGQCRGSSLYCPKGTLWEVSTDHLRQLWHDQGGRCELSGLKMGGPGCKATAIDCLDHRLGYVPGNVRLVCRRLAVSRAIAARGDAHRPVNRGSEGHGRAKHANLAVDQDPRFWMTGGRDVYVPLLSAYRQHVLDVQWMRYMPWSVRFVQPSTGPLGRWGVTFESFLAAKNNDGPWMSPSFLHVGLDGDEVRVTSPVGDDLSRLRGDVYSLYDPKVDLFGEIDRLALEQYRKWCAVHLN